MARKEKFTAEKVADEIKKNRGVLAQAARALGCNRQTVANYIERYATVKAAFEEANETTIDWVESQLFNQIQAGNPTSTIFFLKTKAKHRGYVERQELSGPNGDAIQVKGYAVVSPDDWDNDGKDDKDDSKL